MSEPFTAPTHVPDAVRAAGDAVLVSSARALRAKNWRETERLCRQVLRLDPNHPTAVHLLGLAAQRGGHVTDAISLLKRSLELDGRAVVWWYNLGVSCWASNRLAESAEAFREALRRQPYHVGSLFMLGRSLHAMAMYHDAAAALAQSLRLAPTHRDARALLDLVTAQLQRAA